MNHSIRSLCALLLCLAVVLCIPVQALAAVSIDTGADTALTIHFAYNAADVPGASFRIYHLAQVSGDGRFRLTDAFSGYPIHVDNQTDQGWRELAQALKGYVLEDEMQPDAEGVTDESGLLRFGSLHTGLYFVLGQKLTHEGYVYTIEPTIVSLPNLENDSWIYDVTIFPKSSREEEPTPITEIKVLKAWVDTGAERYRPASVTVNLLKDGKVYDTVLLSSANDWRHTWQELPELDEERMPIDWSVSEKPLTNYNVTIQRMDNVFTVVNTYAGKLPPNPPLPQTGLLWWPVPVLSFLGLCCIAIGALISRRKNQE